MDMKLHRQQTRLIEIIFSFIVLIALPGLPIAFAQTPTTTPTPSVIQQTESVAAPINLSNSGAASQSRIVASPDGILQVFWIDQFEGLLSSVYKGTKWSTPFSVQLPIIYAGNQKNITTEMPDIIEDSNGYVHAFWYGKVNVSTNERPLYHTVMRIGADHWLAPSKVANSAVSYALSTPPKGGIGIAYLRTLNTNDAPPGVYFNNWDSFTQLWMPPHLIYSSIYYRLIEPDKAWIKMAMNDEKQVSVLWLDPQENQYYSSNSNDLGIHWSQPERLQTLDSGIQNPKTALLSQLLIQNWQKNLNKCVLEQRIKLISKTDIDNQNNPTATGETASQWSDPTPILQSLPECPSNDRFFAFPEKEILFWLWGIGSNTIYLSAWNPEKNTWSEPKSFNFSFEDPKTNRIVMLSDLDATLMSGNIVFTGTDAATNEVWFLQTDKNALDMVFTEPSPWHKVEIIQQFEELPLEDQNLGMPSISVDSQGTAHIVWSQLQENNEKNQTAIYYSYWDGALVSQPTILIPPEPNAFHRQPALFSTTDDHLHLAWIQNPSGELYVSWAAADQAYTPDGWIPPQKIIGAYNASYPMMEQDAYGTIYLVYIVPLNENRGVFLVKSDDDGETWTKPKQILDGVTNHIDNLSHPTFAVTPDGKLFVAVVNNVLPGNGFPKEILFITSSDKGKTWSNPSSIAFDKTDWPRLSISKGILHFLYASLERNIIFHRTMPVASQGTSDSDWSIANPIQGFENTIFSFDVTADGDLESPEGEGNVYLVAMDRTGNLLYSIFSNNNYTRFENNWVRISARKKRRRAGKNRLRIPQISHMRLLPGPAWRSIVWPSCHRLRPNTARPKAISTGY